MQSLESPTSSEESTRNILAILRFHLYVYSQPASCEDFTTCKDALNSQRSASRAALGPTCDISFSLIFQLVDKTKAIKNPLGTTPTVAQSVLHLIPRRKEKSPSMIDVSKSEGLWKTQNLGTFHWDQFLRFDLLEHLLAILHLFFSELSYHNYDTTWEVGPVPRPKVSLLRVHQVVPPAPRILSMPGTPLDVTVGGPCLGLLAWRIRRLWLVRASLLLSLGCWQFMTSLQHGMICIDMWYTWDAGNSNKFWHMYCIANFTLLEKPWKTQVPNESATWHQRSLCSRGHTAMAQGVQAAYKAIGCHTVGIRDL